MAQPEFGSIVLNGKEIALSPIGLPVIYFDGAPTLSHLNGIIGVTLIVSGNVPVTDGSVQNVVSVVAHLKCSVPAAASLKNALEGALLLALGNPADADGPKN